MLISNEVLTLGMPVFTSERIKENKDTLDAIRANKDTNDMSASAIKARWFPDDDITAAISKYNEDLIAQLEIKFYMLTQHD